MASEQHLSTEGCGRDVHKTGIQVLIGTPLGIHLHHGLLFMTMYGRWVSISWLASRTPATASLWFWFQSSLLMYLCRKPEL